MSSILVINAAGRETRVALVENGHISEFYLERKKDKGIVGNIYKGRVTRVLPGMQAAFVDIGLDKAAFLYVSEVVYDPEFARSYFELTEGEHDDAAEVPDEENAAAADVTPPSTESVVAAAPPIEVPSSAGLENIVTLLEPVAVLTVPAEAPISDEVVAAPVAPPVSSSLLDTLDASLVASAVVVVPEVQNVEAVAERQARSKEQAAAYQARRGKEEKRGERKMQRIEDLLKVGQEVLVQISKDPIGTKGARLTSHISIPGRHLVFMPTVDHVGISRRISNEKERRRLREVVDRLRPPGTGFIVRTVADNVPKEKLEADIRFLIEVWNETLRLNEKKKQPGLLHPDLDLILRATRDLFAQDVEKLVIDDRDEYARVQNFVASQDDALKARVILHDSEDPIFDAYGIEEEIRRATQRKVWLKSGGYLIIDQAEALTAIDVNSGKYVGKKSLEETITKINTEAAKEIVYQMRLRNIGGIIICDFIDMEKSQNRDKVFRALQESLGRDKAKTNVLRISELGLVEMTRKRVRESIGRILHEDCAYCDGQGFVKTPTTVAYEIFRELRRSAGTYPDPTLVISCHPEVAALLNVEEKQELRHLMDRFNKSIQVRAQSQYHREQYDIFARAAHGAELKLASSLKNFEETDYGAPRPKPSEPQHHGHGNHKPSEGRQQQDGGRRQGRDRDRGERPERTDRPDRPDRAEGGDRNRGGRDKRRDQRGPRPVPGNPSSAAAAMVNEGGSSGLELPANRVNADIENVPLPAPTESPVAANKIDSEPL